MLEACASHSHSGISSNWSVSRRDARHGEPGLRALKEGINSGAIIWSFVRSRLDLGAPGYGLGIWESSAVAASCWCTNRTSASVSGVIVVIVICTDWLSR
jgi:hypothetical protein